MSASATPFADLDPDRILATVESLGLVTDGRVLALNSYENRVYRVGLEDAAPLVAKFYRPGRWSDDAILEEHAFAAELAAAELPFVPPVVLHGRTLHAVDGHRLALFPLRGGHAPEPGDRDVLRHLGGVLGRLHAIGAQRAFAHRPVLAVEAFAVAPVDHLLAEGWLPPDIEDNFAILADELVDRIEDAFDALADLPRLRLHGDCHAGNVLWRDGGAHFVDLDDCLTGPAVQDLWMLAGPREDAARPWRWLLEGYERFFGFDRRALALVEPLRALRLLHFNGWIARRWADPAFPAAFPWFTERRYWESVVAQLQEQLAALDEPVVRPA